jgi:adenine-specific DNA-methyltransferase
MGSRVNEMSFGWELGLVVAKCERVASLMSLSRGILFGKSVGNQQGLKFQTECKLPRIYDKMDESPAVSRHGQVMTKPHVVDLILDLAGYDTTSPLIEKRLLEAGCGNGEFLIAAARRLLEQCPELKKAKQLESCLLGVEKDPVLANEARCRLTALLIDFGFSKSASLSLPAKWVLTGDFLRLPLEPNFDFVVGNPPYVRQEAIEKADLLYCRNTFSCFYDRADLYMAFLEKGLSLLGPDGVFGFICPNRFTRNRYGCKLRSLISRHFYVRHAVDLAQASPFTPDVMAYPGIYVIGRTRTEHVNFFHMTTAEPSECDEVRDALASGNESIQNGVRYHRHAEWFSGDEPWLTESPSHLDLVRRLEEQFPTLGSEQSGTRVGIGVATGADRVFIVPKGFDEVEEELLLPLAMSADCISGTLQWSGNYVINPFRSEASSELIRLSDFPRARSYLKKHEQVLRNRNVSKRNPNLWFRTIDRISPSLLQRPKLLIPDIKAEGVCVLDTGTCYPHHNLYYVVSDYWDLRALRTILRSSLARFFVWTYGVRMRSNFLRFQAQYLRRIPVPTTLNMSVKAIRKLASLDGEMDRDRIDDVVCEFYGLSQQELGLMRQAIDRRSDESP